MSWNRNKISFSSIAVFRSNDPKESSQPIIYVTGSDRNIREIKDGEESLRYEENVTYSQIICGYMRRLLVAGVSETDRPGSIQVFRYDNNSTNRLDKAVEVQAHSKQIERMRLNYDNSKLFSIGLDGVLACFSMKDNDQISKTLQSNQPQIEFSEEILIEKFKLDDTNNRIKSLK